MSLLTIRPYEIHDETAVVALWRHCDLIRPWNDPHHDIQRKLRDSPEWFLIGVMNAEVVASVMAGYDGHRGWLNYLAVAPGVQKRGCGRAMVAAAERLLREAGCAKVNLQVRAGNPEAVEFYRRIGYVVDEVVSLGKRLEAEP